MKNFIKSALVLSTVTLGTMAVLSACSPSEPKIMSAKNTVVSGKANIGGAYELVNHHGQAVTDASFHGAPQLIYFGFAFCPDICPTALQQMGTALERASAQDPSINKFQSLFITVDPERDTVEKMALYVTANGFPKDLIGLTGTAAQINVAKKAYAAIGQKVEDPSSASGYTYDHSSLIYLMDAKGEFVDVFTHADSVDEIVEALIAFNKTQ